MATVIKFRNTTTHPGAIPQNAYRDMSDEVGGGSITLSTDATTPVERFFQLGGIPVGFWSRRVTTEATISGLITFDIQANTALTGFTGRLRAYLYKITAGGSNVETYIGQADALSDIVNQVSTLYTFSFTPSAPVTVAPNERFICRVSVMPVADSFGTGTAFITYSGGAGSLCSVTLTETVTFRPNGVLFRTRATDSGIGNFYDLSETINTVASTTGVVNTTAGGTEIQWTRTAGGTALEWISPRMKSPGWHVNAVNQFGTVVLYALESNVAANCAVRCKFFRRSPSGTETLVATWTVDAGELPTSLAIRNFTNATCVLSQATSFAEDDRFVFRAYIINFGTMGGGFTCTIRYDGITPLNPNDCRIPLLDTPEFKAPGDPDASPSFIPDGLSMGGIGN